VYLLYYTWLGCDAGPFFHQIYTNEIPLSALSFLEFVELVVRQNVRPERPDDEEAPQLSDGIWELAEACWVKNAKERPTAATLCTTVFHLLETTPVARPAQDASPGLSLETLSIARPTSDEAHARSLTPPPNLIIRGHTDEVSCATFSCDGKQIVSGSEDRTIRVWDAQTGNPVLGPLKMHTRGVYSVAFSPNGRRFASGSRDKTILVWHALTGKVVAGPFKGHTFPIRSLCFSPDGKRIASGSVDNTVRIWDAQTGNPLAGPLSGHTDWVISVAFSGDGALIASGSDDQTVRVWDAISGRLVLGPLRGHNYSVYFVAFSPDSKRIVSASLFGNVCVWNADTGARVSGPSLRHAEGALAVVFAPKSSYCAVSPGGRWIAAYTNIFRRTVRVWDSKTGQVMASESLEGHTNYINSITFSPDGRRVLTASYDKTIRVHTLDS
jgi:WD40 repeat protein